jgi:glutamyl-tRNA synthetase
MSKYVTRFAPSPTGDFHWGSARTAYQNWLAARASGGTYILRIDDTDAARNDDAYVDVILDAMSWLGLDYDAMFRQSHRRDVYDYYVNRLLDGDLAYRDVTDAGTAIRLKPVATRLAWKDNIAGQIKITDNDRKNADGLVLMRSDGSPTYHFASIIDDIDMGVNLIIRGTDHINNTSKQLAIITALDMVLKTPVHPIEFAHVGLIDHMVDGKRKKMSKRDAAASLLDYRDRGYDPDAMLDFIIRLGWSPSDANFDRKVKMLTRDMAVDMFLTGGNLRSSPSLFDPVKLDSLNRRWKAAKEVAARENV